MLLGFNRLDNVDVLLICDISEKSSRKKSLNIYSPIINAQNYKCNKFKFHFSLQLYIRNYFLFIYVAEVHYDERHGANNMPIPQKNLMLDSFRPSSVKDNLRRGYITVHNTPLSSCQLLKMA